MNCERHPDREGTLAFRAGYEAYGNGEEVWENAYSDKDQPDEAGDWREGWLKAAADNERIADMDERDKVIDGRRSI